MQISTFSGHRDWTISATRKPRLEHNNNKRRLNTSGDYARGIATLDDLTRSNFTNEMTRESPPQANLLYIA